MKNIVILALALASGLLSAQNNNNYGGGVTPTSTCGDSTHALGWTGSAYNCQNVTGTGNTGIPTNAQTGTSYAVVTGDRLSYVTFSNSSAIAVSLPQAGSAGFTANFAFVTCDIGTGTATITPATSTISWSDGNSYTSAASTLALTTGQCAWIYSDNTNYFAIVRGKFTATGTAALGTGAISSGTCATVVTSAATGVATTDVIEASFNGDPTGVTGYTPSANGMLTIIAYPTSGNVNFKVCNNTASSITPGAITLNWRVAR